MLLSWVTPIIKKGFKKPLELSDLGKLPRSETAAFNYQRIQKLWTEEVNKEGLENASIGKTLLRALRARVIAGAMLFLLALLISFVGPVCKTYIHINTYTHIIQFTPNWRFSGTDYNSYILTYIHSSLWYLRCVNFERRGKPEYPENNPRSRGETTKLRKLHPREIPL